MSSSFVSAFSAKNMLRASLALLAGAALAGCYSPGASVRTSGASCSTPGGAGVYVSFPASPVLGGSTDGLRISAATLVSDLRDEGIENAVAGTEPSSTSQAMADARLHGASWLLTIVPKNWSKPARLWSFDPSEAHFKVEVRHLPSGSLVRTDDADIPVGLLTMQTAAVDEEEMDDAWSDYAEDLADPEDSLGLCAAEVGRYNDF